MLKIRLLFAKIFSKKKKFNVKNMKQQNLAFPATIIQYILSTNPGILQKLCRTCKFWFVKYPFIFAESLFHRDKYPYIFSDSLSYAKHTEELYSIATKNDILLISDISKKIPPLKLCIFNSITINNVRYYLSPRWRKQFSTISSKIYYCQLKNLQLLSLDITFKEWKLLTSSMTIIDCWVANCTVKHNDDLFALVEDLLPTLINAEEILLHLRNTNHFSSSSMQKLLNIEFSPKLKKFYFGEISLPFDYETFLLFVKKNAKLKGQFFIIPNETNSDIYLEININIQNLKRLWESEFQNVVVGMIEDKSFLFYNPRYLKRTIGLTI